MSFIEKNNDLNEKHNWSRSINEDHGLRTNENEGHDEVKARKKKMEGIIESENKKCVMNFLFWYLNNLYYFN